MEMKLFTRSKKIEAYNEAGMSSDFKRVKHIVETTKNPTQFQALQNLVNNFTNKWRPVGAHRFYGCEVAPRNVAYENAVNYLHLKLQYEYEKIS